MLTFTLGPGAGQWHWNAAESSWRAGAGRITPFEHPALESSHTSDGRGDLFVVREKRPGGDRVELTVTAAGQVRIGAGPGGVAPISVVADGSGERLVGSWDPADLAAVCGDELSPLPVARLLSRRQRYSSETVFAGMVRVGAGATLTWGPRSAPAVRYPEPAEHVVRPRVLRARADPVTAFAGLLDHVVADVVAGQVGPVAVEVSGGVDSANVLQSVVAVPDTTLVTGGLLVHGVTGIAQRRRRRAIIGPAGVPDVTIPVREHLPLDPGGTRTPRRPHYPDGDVYEEAFGALYARLRGADARLVLTGHGGDEIMGRTPAERGRPAPGPPLGRWLSDRTREALRHVDEGCSPVTPVALATLLVFAARHPAYLRAGLWPVAPFADPRVSRFGRSLPVEWRYGKRLLRRRLSRAGFPASVTDPRRSESFAPTMRLALRRNAAALLTEMLDRSVLIEQGFVCRGAVERLLRDARGRRPLPTTVYDMLALDIGVRSMTGAPCRTEEPLP